MANNLIKRSNNPMDIAIEEKKKNLTFTEVENKQISQIKNEINISNADQVLNFANEAQEKITNFSDNTLANVRNKDLSDIGELLDNIVVEVNKIPESQRKGLMGWFKGKKNDLTLYKQQFESSEANIQSIAEKLDEKRNELLDDMDRLDELYILNENYFRELSMYIEAGNQKIDELKSIDLPQLESKAQSSSLAIDSQKVTDLKNQINEFEKKIYDLETTRTISLQMAPQIRMIEASNKMMAQKIDATKNSTIPLWKNQLVLAISAKHTEDAIEVQNKITDATNKLLRMNSEKVSQNTINTARASERAIVDVDTLKKTNEDLIKTIEEVRKIQVEGSKQREEAKKELQKINDDLKKNLSK